MLDKMTNIKIPRYKLEYKVQKNKNIIQGSLEKNIKLPFSCRSGICGTCKAKIINGSVNKNNKINHVLTPLEKKNNIILACQAEPVSDELELEILSPVSEQVNQNKPKEVISEILTVKSISSEVQEIRISVSKRFLINFNLLSYMEIIIPGIDLKEKYYIIASEKHNGLITILIYRSNNKKINNYLLKTLKTGNIITIKGPYVENNITKISKSPILFLAKDMYIIKTITMIKNLLASNFVPQIMLICLYLNKETIFMMDEMHKLQFLYNNFSYKIILSQSDQSQVNRFLYGNISNNLNKIFPDLSNHFIYLGGDDVFIKQTKLKVSELGGKKENIYINC